jgi:hypothetical protein
MNGEVARREENGGKPEERRPQRRAWIVSRAALSSPAGKALAVGAAALVAEAATRWMVRKLGHAGEPLPLLRPESRPAREGNEPVILWMRREERWGPRGFTRTVEALALNLRRE